MTQHQKHNRKSHHLELKGLCKISLKIEHKNKKQIFCQKILKQLELKTQYQINAHFEFFFQHIWTQSLI
jgi:hypothetical protein